MSPSLNRNPVFLAALTIRSPKSSPFPISGIPGIAYTRNSETLRTPARDFIRDFAGRSFVEDFFIGAADKYYVSRSHLSRMNLDSWNSNEAQGAKGGPRAESF